MAREVSKGMEAERKALGLQGVLFRYYSCPACGQADIFVAVNPLPGEMPAEFVLRRQELEEAARGLHAEQVEVVLGARQSRVPGAMAVAHPQPAWNERPRHLFCTFNP
jgi:hypothetical protein